MIPLTTANAAFIPSIQVVESLKKILADTHILYVKAHGFHWNVTGFRFNDLHAFFGNQYDVKKFTRMSVCALLVRIRAS